MSSARPAATIAGAVLSQRMISQAGLAAAAAAAIGTLGSGYARRRRLRSGDGEHRRSTPPSAPLTTQSSPGQIADLQQAYGADMAPGDVNVDPPD